MSDKSSQKPAKKLVKSNTKNSTVVDVTRNISHPKQLLLCILAGGRCEFDGCNKFLFEHPLTHKRFNFAQMAHIVAFSELGPRGNVTDRPTDINSLDNLMLLCHACHKQIDDFPDEFSRETLEGYKKAHEGRIYLLTSAAPDRQTTAVILKSKIGEKMVKISPAEINEAVSPRYSATRNGTEIDLTNINDEGEEFYAVAAKKVKRDIERILESVMTDEKTNHISLFALAPMPILVYAGNLLSNKVPCDLYQKHRDTQDWKWKTDGESAQYKFHRLKKGADGKKVALVLSLSGKIHLDDLPSDVIDDAFIYEITLEGMPPHTGFLRQKQDLVNFGVIYQRSLREIGTLHGKLEELHLFPAVPAPVAVVCGQELMPKTDPVLVIYDDDKRHGGYRKIMEVNN
jgi:hypothetical protein